MYIKTNTYTWSYLALTMRHFSDKSRKENQNTLLCPIYFFSPKIVPLMRWCGKNIVDPDRPQMTIWRMCFACWITKATNARSEYETLIFHRNSGYANALSATLRLHYPSCFVYNIHWLGLTMEELFYVRYELNDYLRCMLIWPPKNKFIFLKTVMALHCRVGFKLRKGLF
jgi:hypothetical protein